MTTGFSFASDVVIDVSVVSMLVSVVSVVLVLVVSVVLVLVVSVVLVLVVSVVVFARGGRYFIPLL